MSDRGRGGRHRGRRASRYSSAPEEVTKRRSKRRSTRSDDGGAIYTSEHSGVVDRQERQRSECCVLLGLTLTAPPFHSPIYSGTESLTVAGLGGRMGHRLARSYGAWPEPRAHVGRADLGSELGFLQGNRPNTVTVFLFFCFISL
jgi:hypothetical protein